MDKATLIGNIVTGECDDFLADISDAVRARKASRVNTIPWRTGVHVRLSGLSTQYLNGAVCVVTKVNPKKLMVAFPNDARYGRYSGSQRVSIPKSCCEIVEPSID